MIRIPGRQNRKTKACFAVHENVLIYNILTMLYLIQLIVNHKLMLFTRDYHTRQVYIFILPIIVNINYKLSDFKHNIYILYKIYSNM